MSTTLALAVAANGQAAVAAARAAEAERLACLSSMRGYVHDAATETAIRAYAACAERLYPSAMSAGSMFAIKLSVAVLLIGAVAGAVRGYARGDTVFGGLTGFFAAAAACATGWAIWFLLT